MPTETQPTITEEVRLAGLLMDPERLRPELPLVADRCVLLGLCLSARDGARHRALPAETRAALAESRALLSAEIERRGLAAWALGTIATMGATA